MGCMFGREQYEDDDIYVQDGRHHHYRANRRVVPHDNYCLLCRCQQYTQHRRDSNRCVCGHTPDEHKTI